MSSIRTHGPATAQLLVDPAFPYRELLLQFIWERQLLRTDDLRTTEGDPVEVLAPGRIHGSSGPDLRDARIRIGGQLWSGSVEVHVRSREWYQHGHQHDPAYDNVILHVVHTHDAEVVTAAGVRPPTVQLADRIHEDQVRRYRALLGNAGAKPCAAHIGAMDDTRKALWLDRLLVERLERKVAGVEQAFRAADNDPSEAFYRLFLQGMGGPTNGEAFAQLALALPLKVLLKYRDDPVRIEALLLGQAGFLATDPVDDHPRRLQEEYRLLAQLHGLRSMSTAAWKFSGMRPAAFPTVRLAQLAQLLHGSAAPFSDLLDTDDPRRLVRALAVRAAPYWDDHYVIDRRTSARRIKRIGALLAGTLVINTIVPYLFAMGRLRADPSLRERALALLEGLPTEQNSVIAGWRTLHMRPVNAARSQALLELESRYCTRLRCLTCAIGNHLLQGCVKEPGPSPGA